MVDINNTKRFNQFFKNFLQVHHAPAIRILKVDQKIERYKFIGNFEANTIDYFIQNYLYHNLLNY